MGVILAMPDRERVVGGGGGGDAGALPGAIIKPVFMFTSMKSCGTQGVSKSVRLALAGKGSVSLAMLCEHTLQELAACHPTIRQGRPRWQTLNKQPG